MTYDDEEFTAIRDAAATAGLTVAGYVGDTAVASAAGTSGPRLRPDREVLMELIAVRSELGRLAMSIGGVGRTTASDRPGGPDLAFVLRSLINRTDAAVQRLLSCRGQSPSH